MEVKEWTICMPSMRPRANSGSFSTLQIRLACWPLPIPTSLISPDGQPSEFGLGGLDALKTRLANLFERFKAKLAVIVIEIRLHGDVTYDYGWHDLTLTPKDGGEPIHRRDCYVDIWRKDKEGNWKLWMYMDNRDIADPFCSEEVS